MEITEKNPLPRFNKSPLIKVSTDRPCIVGWKAICQEIEKQVRGQPQSPLVVVIECYQGVLIEDLEQALASFLPQARCLPSSQAFHKEQRIREMVYPDVTEDRIFGYMTRLTMGDYFDSRKVHTMRQEAKESALTVVYGTGAAWIVPDADLLLYADMARWEIQLRMRQHLVDNLGVNNRNESDWMLLYKQGYFVDWRVCDRFKKRLWDKIDFLLDTNQREQPKMVAYQVVLQGLDEAIRCPFSVVPFFDPGPWGGQWMKSHCDLDKEQENFAWCFNCVPEENSLLLKVGNEVIEIPSINLVFLHPIPLLGEAVHARFGDEFPIRFDYLDTIDGGHLSLQVHPLTEYIQEQFGLHYTQDESYYILDAKAGAKVYLGLRDGVNPALCIEELERAQREGISFDAEKHVATWEAKKHDHFLIPAGTIHCSGAGCMVLEVSATPYIFTFKLWDWGRVGLDGKPRPINIEHGKKVIQWERTECWTKRELINRVEEMGHGEGWREERTGLHEREFIETRRHWFSVPVEHHTQGGVHVLALIEGSQAVVESPMQAFAPFVVNYAETFIVPAAVGAYTIRPYGLSEGKECATLKAFVRTGDSTGV